MRICGVCARRAVDMQESSVWGVHQTHSATRDDDGVRERETRQRVRKRAHTLNHTTAVEEGSN